MLVHDSCVAGRLLGSSNEHGLAIVREGEVINIGLTLVVFKTFDGLRGVQPPRVLAAPSLVIAVVTELKAVFNAPFDVVAIERLRWELSVFVQRGFWATLTLVVLLGKLALPVLWWEALDCAWELGGWRPRDDLQSSWDIVHRSGSCADRGGDCEEGENEAGELHCGEVMDVRSVDSCRSVEMQALMKRQMKTGVIV